MIEEELAPVYTNAPEETPSPELPQKPIAGGVEKDFNELIVGGMSNMLQDEQEQNVRQNQINVEDKRKKLNAIRGGMMEREDHSEQEKSIAVQNWITESTGKLPKNHVEMRFAMDKLWKRAGKDGLAPSYEAVFDVVKERFHEDKMQADEEEGYFKAGAKSMFSPKMYSWDQTIKQQDIDPKRMKILKAMYDEGAKAQKDRYPQDMVAKINLAMEAANSIKTDEVTAGGKRQADWTKKSEDAEPSYGDIIEDLTVYTKGMNQKDKSLFVAGLRESIQSDPAKNKKASDFFSQFGLNASRSVGRFSETTAGGLDFFKNLFHEANVNASELYAPFLPYGEMAHSYFEQVYKDELHETDMKKQLSDMFLNEYDPIQPFARQDTVLNWIEEGVFYQTPQVLASVGVPLLATVLTGGSGGLIAAAGSAGSLGWIGGISGSEISESQRQGYLDSGVSFDEASQRARDPLAKAWTIPHVAMGLLKVNTFARKIPLFDKALSKMDGTIRSKGLRLAAKTGLLGTAETAEEWGQDIWTEFLKEVSHQIDGEMDSPEWFGEGAFFDDFWAKSVVTFSSMGGLSMASAAGALSMEDRAAAWAELPPLVRQAAGHQQKDIDALTEADNPRDQVRAYIDSEKNKDGQSPQVTEAIKGLEEAALLQAQEIQDAQSKGLFPRSEVELLDGKPNIKVFDPETNDIILETDSFVDATTVSFDWWGKKEEDFKDEFIYVKSMFQAATMLSEQAPELVQRLSIGEQMTDTKFRETGAEAARSIAEEVKRNEMINGGDGSMANLIFGTNQVQREAGQTKIINGLFAGATVETLLHEAGHGFFKKGISDGTIDMDDAVKLLKRVDKAFQGRFTKAIKFEGKERPVESMRLLPDVDNPTFQMVDEGLMQLYSAVILGEGKLAPYRKLINDSMSAYAKSNSKSKIGNFISAMRYYFNLALSRAVAIKGMVRRGEIDQKDLDKVRAWMQGTSLQEEITGEAKKEFDATMRDGVEGTSYSTSPAFYSKMEDVLDKKIQGKQATPEQIKSIIDPSKGSGVKAEEIKWTGVIQKIDQLAADNNGKVPKAELMDWLKNDAAVEFEEVVMGDGGNKQWTQEDIDSLEQEARRTRNFDAYEQAVLEYEDQQLGTNANDTGNETQYAEYQVPNGENYKETVLTMPVKGASDKSKVGEYYDNFIRKGGEPSFSELSIYEQQEVVDTTPSQVFNRVESNYTSSHFPDIPNYVAHMRTNEREDSTGDEGLFIEEIQSDLHQEGRKVGYNTPRGVDTAAKELTEALNKNAEKEGLKPLSEPLTSSEAQEMLLRKAQFDWVAERIGEDEAIRLAELARQDKNSVPDAPFRKDWHLQMFKRGLRDAIAAGKDWIGWTVGQTQNERYDLSKQVKEVVVPMINKDGTRSVRVEVKENSSSIKMMVDKNAIVTGQYSNAWQFNGKKLDEVLGKDVAEKIMNLTEPTTLTGNDLAVGGSGMKGFYDKMLPTAVQKYVKQWGAKVEDGALKGEHPDGWAVVNTTDPTNYLGESVYNTEADADIVRRQAGITKDDKNWQVKKIEESPDVPFHKVAITDAMRESIEEIGQTSFSISPAQDADIVWDRSEGWGSVPNQRQIEYFGFTKSMSPVVFRNLVPDGVSGALTVSNIRKEKPSLAPPFLQVDWDDSKKAWLVRDHEGRSRAMYAMYLNDADIPVDLLTYPMRAKGLTEEMKNAPIIPQGGGDPVMAGNVVETGWTPDASFSISPAQDAAYMDAVESGDVETQQRMVDEAAKRAGYDSPKVYHGTTIDFESFDPAKTDDPNGWWFSVNRDWAARHGKPKSFYLKDYKAWAGNEDFTVPIESINQIKSADPVTYDADGNVIPLSQRFDASRDEISMSQGWQPEIRKSILTNVEKRMSTPQMKAEVIGDIQRRVQKLISDADSLKTKESFKDKRLVKSLRKEAAMRQALRSEELEKEGVSPSEAKSKAKAEFEKWFNNERLAIEKDRPKTIRSMLVTYEAILMALPTDIRGKMGNVSTIVDLNSEKQVLEFFDKKLNKLEKVVDSWISKKFDKSAKNLFKRALSKTEAGKKDKGKMVGELAASFNRVFSDTKAIMDKISGEYSARVKELRDGGATLEEAKLQASNEAEIKVSAEVSKIESTIEESLAADVLTSEKENELEIKKNMIQFFGNWRNSNNSDKEAALKYGWREFEYAYLMSNIEKARRREELEAKAADLLKATGIDPEDIDIAIDNNMNAMGKFRGRIRAAKYNLLDFEQVLSSLFPDTKQVVEKVVQEQQADAQYQDRMEEHHQGVDKFLASLVGDSILSLKALRLQDSLTRDTKSVVGGGHNRSLTPMQMIQARLMWRQEDGRRHMENWANKEEEGQKNYNQEFMDAIDKLMSPEAKALEGYLITQYEQEYDRINEVHERLFGVSLPKNLMYSPLTVSPLQQIKASELADPLSGQSIQGMGVSSQSLIRRSKTASAKPEFRDALATFYAHKQQMEYWMAYAELVKELQSLIGNRNVSEAVKAKGGAEAVRVVKQWVEVLSNNGIKDSALASQLNGFMMRGVNRTSSAILAGRMSTLVIQSTQMGAALAQMPTKDYVWRMGKLLSGNLEFAEAFNSDFIQRRLREAPPAVKMAMQGMASGSPSIAKESAQKLGTLISGADAFFTSGTYAIILDYLTTKRGMSSAEAHTEATRLTEQVAQPTRLARRSMAEIQFSKNALAKLSWAFASEARQKIALSAYRWNSKFTLAEKTRALAVTWGFGGAVASIIRAVSGDLRDDDDDEIFDEKYWNPTRMVLQTLLGPLQGIPLYGEMAETGIMKGFRKAGADTGYIFNNDSMLSSMTEALPTAIGLYGTAEDVITGGEETEKLIKDIDKLLISVAPLNDTASALSSFSHLVRDLFMIGKNAID